MMVKTLSACAHMPWKVNTRGWHARHAGRADRSAEEMGTGQRVGEGGGCPSAGWRPIIPSAGTGCFSWHVAQSVACRSRCVLLRRPRAFVCPGAEGQSRVVRHPRWPTSHAPAWRRQGGHKGDAAHSTAQLAAGSLEGEVGASGARAGCTHIQGVCGPGCAAQGVSCKRAGRRAARKARSGGTQPLRRNASCARYMPPCVAVPQIRSQPSAHRLWASSWLAPHSTAQAAACCL